MKKVIYYSDELNDDFAPGLKVAKPVQITEKYDYLARKNVIVKFFSFLLYRVIATPVAIIYMRLFKGLRVKNARNLRKIKGGFFLYGNHTQVAGDAFTPSVLTFPKRANILVHPDAVSIPFVRVLVPLLGGVPVPSNLGATRNLIKAMPYYLKKRQAIVVYPEAHIWPYFNGIRDFTDSSFAYPFLFDVPAVAFTVTYRQSKIFKNARPLVTVTVGKPVYPKDCSGKTEMREKIYSFMVETVKKEKSFAYVEYIKKGKDEDDDNSNLRCAR